MSRTALDGAHSQHHDSLTNANFSTEPQCPLYVPPLCAPFAGGWRKLLIGMVVVWQDGWKLKQYRGICHDGVLNPYSVCYNSIVSGYLFSYQRPGSYVISSLIFGFAVLNQHHKKDNSWNWLVLNLHTAPKFDSLHCRSSWFVRWPPRYFREQYRVKKDLS